MVQAKSPKKPASKKSPAAKKAKSAKTSNKVADFEPTKMTFLVASLAVISLVILALLATYS